MLFSPLNKNPYKTLNLIRVYKDSLLYNFNYFQKLNPQAKICPVLKSNAYGHGLKLVGKFVDSEIKPEFICVDSLYEAYELNKAIIKTNILIMGYTFPENFKYLKNDFRIPLFDLETLKILNKYRPQAKVHIKIDTGMNRLGIKPSEVELFIKNLKKYPKVEVEGIYSHLSDADNPNDLFSLKQIKLFKEVIRLFENSGFSFKYKHICATAGALKFHDPEFNLIRLGLGFYGISTFSEELKSSLEYITHIAEIKSLEKGETVSYGRTFSSNKQMIIGILPLGYYDGIDRRLSNCGEVTVGGVDCRILGRVCMNITVIDLSGVNKPYVGQEAVVYRSNTKNLNSIKHTADKIETIPYEVLVKLSETTKRILV